MCKAIVGTLLALSAAAMGGVADNLDQWLPQSTSDFAVRDPLVSVCGDQAVWLCWWQKSPNRQFTTNPANMGVYCKLVSGNGKSIVGSTRVAKAASAWMHYSPTVFFLAATPDGGAFLLLHGPPGPQPTAPLGPAHGPVPTTTGDDGPPGKTMIMHVDRHGGMGEISVDFQVMGSSSMQGSVYRPAGGGRYQVVFGAKGAVHCFLAGFDGTACYVRLLLRPGAIKSVGLRKFAFSRSDPNRPLSSDYETPSETERCLWSVIGDRARTATYLIAKDTLLVACAQSTPDYDHAFGHGVPGDTLTVLKIRLPDLVLVDSVRVAVGSVASHFFKGQPLEQAVLAKSIAGYTFFLPRPGGTSSYSLGPDGRPLSGSGDTLLTLKSSDYRTHGSQVVDFKWYHDMPWVIDWFGLGVDGLVYHDSHRTDSVPGRLD